MEINNQKGGIAEMLRHGAIIKQKVPQENKKTEENSENGEDFYFGKNLYEKQYKDEQELKPQVEHAADTVKPEPEEDAFYDIPAKQTIYIKLVLDSTISMSMLYPYIYSRLSRLVVNLDKKLHRLRQKGCVGLKWGITLITDDKPETVKFSNKTFTSSTSQIDTALKNIVFHGGTEDGYENVTGAIEQAIKDLSDESEGCGNRGVFVLTDSLPYEDEKEKDFRYCATYTQLRFAYCYVYDYKQFLPIFNIVNGSGEADMIGFRSTEVGDLQSYLEGEDSMIQEMLRKILEQTSTNVGYL